MPLPCKPAAAATVAQPGSTRTTFSLLRLLHACPCSIKMPFTPFVFVILATTCTNVLCVWTLERYHGMSPHDTLCARCHNEVRSSSLDSRSCSHPCFFTWMSKGGRFKTHGNVITFSQDITLCSTFHRLPKRLDCIIQGLSSSQEQPFPLLALP